MEFAIFLTLTCLVTGIDSAKKSSMAQKFDALDNLFQRRMFLVSEELETGRVERELLSEKLNETITYLEKQAQGNTSTLAYSDIEVSQIDLDKLTEKIEHMTDRVEQNDRETDQLSESLFRYKRGVQQEKLARKHNAEAVIGHLLDVQINQNKTEENSKMMLENQKETKENLNVMQDNLNEIKKNLKDMQENQNKTKQSLKEMQIHQNEMQKNLNDMRDIQNEMKTKQNEMVTNVNTVISNQNNLLNQMADLIRNTAPKLYCGNQLGLDACLEKHFQEQQQLSNLIIGRHQTVWLVGGSTKCEGRVEVIYWGRRGTVCDDLWDNNAAVVVCRMLGYTGGTALQGPGSPGGHSFGMGNGEILLYIFKCTGGEASLFDCGHLGVSVNNCNHKEDAGVICNP